MSTANFFVAFNFVYMYVFVFVVLSLLQLFSSYFANSVSYLFFYLEIYVTIFIDFPSIAFCLFFFFFGVKKF